MLPVTLGPRFFLQHAPQWGQLRRAVHQVSTRKLSFAPGPGATLLVVCLAGFLGRGTGLGTDGDGAGEAGTGTDGDGAGDAGIGVDGDSSSNSGGGSGSGHERLLTPNPGSTASIL